VADELTLQMAISTLSPSAYREKRSDVEHAQMSAQHAQNALTAHRKEHGC